MPERLMSGFQASGGVFPQEVHRKPQSPEATTTLAVMRGRHR